MITAELTFLKNGESKTTFANFTKQLKDAFGGVTCNAECLKISGELGTLRPEFYLSEEDMNQLENMSKQAVLHVEKVETTKLLPSIQKRAKVNDNPGDYTIVVKHSSSHWSAVTVKAPKYEEICEALKKVLSPEFHQTLYP